MGDCPPRTRRRCGPRDPPCAVAPLWAPCVGRAAPCSRAVAAFPSAAPVTGPLGPRSVRVRPVVWQQGTCGCPVTKGRSCRRRSARDGPRHGRQSSASQVSAPRCGSPLRYHHHTNTCIHVYACMCAHWGGGASINTADLHQGFLCAASIHTRLLVGLTRARAPLSSARRRHRRRSNLNMLYISQPRARRQWRPVCIHACVCQSSDALPSSVVP